MRKLLMPILMTWALNKMAERYMHPKASTHSRGAARGFNPNFASEFMGSRYQGGPVPYGRLGAAIDAFKTAWKNYRE